MFENILLTLDGSPFGEQAIPYAVELAKCHGGTLHILRVAQVHAPIDFEVGTAVYQNLLAQELTVAQNYVDTAIGRLRAEGIDVEGEVLMGDPATVILDRASRTGASVIVMATHGRSGLGRLVFGSVADQVLRGATAPVLMVRVVEMKSEAVHQAEGSGAL